jgi:polysaccharide export outer membrane protein
MWYKKSHIIVFAGIFLMLFAESCVTMKRQILVHDKSKKNLKAIQQTDTILKMIPFTYYLKPRDVIGINLVSVVKGEYDFSNLNQMGNTNVSAGTGAAAGANDANNGYIIDENGEILLPIVGKIKIGGLSVPDAKKEIQKQVNKYLDNITVNIKMLNFYVVMMGEVVGQGRIQAEREQLTILDAIAMSGGFKDFANRNKIKIIRRDNLDVHIFYIDITDQNILASEKIYLMPNDIVLVEPMRSKNIRAYSIANISLILSSISLLIALGFTFNSLFGRL